MFGMKLGLIVELLVVDQEEGAARSLLRRGTQHLLERGAEAIACVIPDRAPYGSALRREGFLRIPDQLLPRQFHFMVRPRPDDPGLISALNPESWYLSWGDNDAV
jgi:hypothetical protein